MALIKCSECSSEVSTQAKTCPKCGAKVPHTKWWLWVPLALVVIFMAYGASIPEYEGRAREVRKVCEKMAVGVPGGQDECDRAYHRAIVEGKAREK